MLSPTILLVLTALLSLFIYILTVPGRRSKHLPPGPPTYPLLGNLPQIPLKGAHFQFSKWARQYGGIYSLKLGTGTAVVLTDRRLVKELIDKKSAKYSERPKSYVANLISGGDHILLMDYGNQWRDTRKLLHGTFMEKTCEDSHIHLQESEARQMLRDYLLHPEDHMLHPKRFSNSITMSLVWGIRTSTPQTRHMERLYALMEVWSKVMEPGAMPPVDIYPFLHYLPQSIFLNWRDRAEHVRKEMNHLYSDFLSDIRARRKREGKGRGCFMDKVLDQAESEKRMEGLKYTDHELWFMGGTLTEGGSDTTASILTAFVQAMATNPTIQQKAHDEIDSIIPPSRSPTWSDYASLPYIAATVKETMRHRPVTPLAFPHALSSDDTINGYVLPKGTTVILNAWGLHMDPTRFSNPEAFDPDHFKNCTRLAPDLANGAYGNRDHYGYGAGRRFCPGAHLAERNLFLAMAKILWAFEIKPKVKDGMEVEIDTDPRTGYHEGFLVCARDFECEFVVRGEERTATILREFEQGKGLFEAFQAAGGEKA